MRVWPAPTVGERLSALPWPVVAAVAAVLVIAAGMWGLTPPHSLNHLSAGSPAPAGASASDADGVDAASAEGVPGGLEVPAAALVATLYDELFPEPPPAAPPPTPEPPPKLDVALVAITADAPGTSAPTGLRAFVRVASTGDYLWLAVDDQTPGGAVVTRIDSDAVVFTLGRREVRVEIES